MERLHFGTTTVKPTERQRINSANLTCRKHVPGTWYTKCQKMSFFITWYYMVNRYHPTRTLTRTLARTLLWSDQCLDAVAREGSRLIRPTWMLCLERLNVDWTLIGPARDAVGYCVT